MGLNVKKTGAACGAFVTGLDLTQDLSDDIVGEIRAHWLENKVWKLFIWNTIQWHRNLNIERNWRKCYHR